MLFRSERFIAPSAQKPTSVASTPKPEPVVNQPEPSAQTPGPAPAPTPAPATAPDMPKKSDQWKPGMEPIAGGAAVRDTSKEPVGGKTPSLPSMAQPGGGASNNAKEGEQKMKAMASLKEDVQVGNYKYRIV